MPVTPPKSTHILKLRPTPNAPTRPSHSSPRPAVSHCVTGGARKLSGAGWLGVGVLRVRTGEDTLGPLSSTPASGELSPCRINNGGCQDLCLLTHQGHVNCSCRGGRILQDDFTCQGERGTRALRGGPGHRWEPSHPRCSNSLAPTNNPAPRSLSSWRGEGVQTFKPQLRKLLASLPSGEFLLPCTRRVRVCQRRVHQFWPDMRRRLPLQGQV